MTGKNPVKTTFFFFDGAEKKWKKTIESVPKSQGWSEIGNKYIHFLVLAVYPEQKNNDECPCQVSGLRPRPPFTFLVLQPLALSICVDFLHTQTFCFYGPEFGENTYGSITRFIRVGGFQFSPSILPLHKLLSFASAGDRAHLVSSFNAYIQVFLGLPLSLFPSTSNLEHLYAQSSSLFLSTCANHTSPFLLYKSLMGSVPILALSSLLGFLSLNDTSHIHPIILIQPTTTSINNLTHNQ
jgi:hypothetical protein